MQVNGKHSLEWRTRWGACELQQKIVGPSDVFIWVVYLGGYIPVTVEVCCFVLRALWVWRGCGEDGCGVVG